MLCLYHSDLDDQNLTSSPSQSSSTRQSSIEPSQLGSSQPSPCGGKEPSQGLPLKRKQKQDKASDSEVDNLVIQNLKALDEPAIPEDEEELFGRQVQGRRHHFSNGGANY